MKFLFSIPIFFIIACSNVEKENILFNNISFQLESKEKYFEKDTAVTNYFFSYFKSQKEQLPLYKYVNTNNYKIYIALPYQFDFKLLSQKKLLKLNSLTFENVGTTSVYREYKHSKKYFSEYIVKIDDDLIYLLAESSDKLIRDSLLNQKQISSRFK